MPTLRIDNAEIITMNGEMGVESGWTLLAVDGEITYVGPVGDAPALEVDELVDGSDCLLLPGFVNAHTHAAMTLFRGNADDMELQPWLEEKIWPVEATLTEDDVYWGAMLGCVEMLRAGVTCFADMYHMPEVGTRASIDAGIRARPSGVLLGLLPNAGDMLAKAEVFCRDHDEAGDGLIKPMLAPHAPYTCPEEMLRQVIGVAGDLGVPIHIHMAETDDNVQWSLENYGARPAEAMKQVGLFDVPVLAAHCVHLDEADIAIMADEAIGVAHCPGSNLKLASGIAPVAAMLAAGVQVGLGTDGCGSNNNLDLLQEALLAALVAKVQTGDPTAVPAAAALRMATLGGAEAVFLADRIGSLEVGKRADCILVDLTAPHMYPRHNLVSDVVYSAQSADVRATIVDGCVLVRDGEFTQLDEAEVMEKACESAARLFG